jgi:F-type H+-transporting ATPase subunit delta
MAKTARQAKREANQLFRLCLVHGWLDERRARQVVERVLQSRRRGYLGVAKQFHRLVKLDSDRHTAKIESAIPLAADLKASVRTGIESAYGHGITTVFAQNPALIGGMRIRVGCDVYDGSVQCGLVALEKCFGITSANGRNAGI